MSSKNNINILIVDDSLEHIRIASSILKSLKYPIRVANNGMTALKLIKEQIPTLILLDIIMPKINGFEICNIIKKNPLYQDIAIIFMTADQDEESIQKGFSLGAQDYVVKPYKSSELIARVKTHIKLASQSNELKSAYKELDQFCHTVSHDLKSPLNVIKQLSNLLSLELGNTLTEDALEIMNRIDNKSSEVILMIERLLEFSKMGQLECNYTAVDLHSLFNEIMNELTSLEKPSRKIKFNLGKLPTINGDKTLLKFLIQNILSNSLKFSNKNDITIINVFLDDRKDSYEISIQDNGVGFNMKYSNKLFRIFERLHSKEEFEGSGVGLAIVKRIMDRHNGAVYICSQLYKGVTVTLSFPK